MKVSVRFGNVNDLMKRLFALTVKKTGAKSSLFLWLFKSICDKINIFKTLSGGGYIYGSKLKRYSF